MALDVGQRKKILEMFDEVSYTVSKMRASDSKPNSNVEESVICYRADVSYDEQKQGLQFTIKGPEPVAPPNSGATQQEETKKPKVIQLTKNSFQNMYDHYYSSQSMGEQYSNEGEFESVRKFTAISMSLTFFAEESKKILGGTIDLDFDYSAILKFVGITEKDFKNFDSVRMRLKGTDSQKSQDQLAQQVAAMQGSQGTDSQKSQDQLAQQVADLNARLTEVESKALEIQAQLEKQIAALNTENQELEAKLAEEASKALETQEQLEKQVAEAQKSQAQGEDVLWSQLGLLNEQLTTERSQSEQQIAALNAENQELNAQLAEVESKALETQEQLEKQVAEAQKSQAQGEDVLWSQLGLLNEQLTTERSQSEQQIAALNEKNQELNTQLAEERSQSEKQIADLNAENQELAQLTEEANKALEETQDQLGQLITELQTQATSMASIAEGAEQDKAKLSEQIADLTTERSQSEQLIADLNEKNQELNTQLAEERSQSGKQIADLNAENQELAQLTEEANKALEETQDQLGQLITELQTQATSMASIAEGAEQDKAKLSEQIADLTTERSQSEQLIAALNEKNQELNTQLTTERSQSEQQIAALNAENQELAQLTEEANKALETQAQLEKQIADLKAENQKLQDQNAELQDNAASGTLDQESDTTLAAEQKTQEQTQPEMTENTSTSESEQKVEHTDSVSSVDQSTAAISKEDDQEQIGFGANSAENSQIEVAMTVVGYEMEQLGRDALDYANPDFAEYMQFRRLLENEQEAELEREPEQEQKATEPQQADESATVDSVASGSVETVQMRSEDLKVSGFFSQGLEEQGPESEQEEEPEVIEVEPVEEIPAVEPVEEIPAVEPAETGQTVLEYQEASESDFHTLDDTDLEDEQTVQDETLESESATVDSEQKQEAEQESGQEQKATESQQVDQPATADARENGEQARKILENLVKKFVERLESKNITEEMIDAIKGPTPVGKRGKNPVLSKPQQSIAKEFSGNGLFDLIEANVQTIIKLIGTDDQKSRVGVAEGQHRVWSEGLKIDGKANVLQLKCNPEEKQDETLASYVDFKNAMIAVECENNLKGHPELVFAQLQTSHKLLNALDSQLKVQVATDRQQEPAGIADLAARSYEDYISVKQNLDVLGGLDTLVTPVPTSRTSAVKDVSAVNLNDLQEGSSENAQKVEPGKYERTSAQEHKDKKETSLE